MRLVDDGITYLRMANIFDVGNAKSNILCLDGHVTALFIASAWDTRYAGDDLFGLKSQGEDWKQWLQGGKGAWWD